MTGLSEVPRDEWTEAGVVLIAQLIELLITFIGEELTLHLLIDVWPDLALFLAEFQRKSEQ